VPPPHRLDDRSAPPASPTHPPVAPPQSRRCRRHRRRRLHRRDRGRGNRQSRCHRDHSLLPPPPPPPLPPPPEPEFKSSWVAFQKGCGTTCGNFESLPCSEATFEAMKNHLRNHQGDVRGHEEFVLRAVAAFFRNSCGFLSKLRCGCRQKSWLCRSALVHERSLSRFPSNFH